MDAHFRLTQMQTSKVVEVDGVFIGAAVLLPNNKGWRFVAAHARALEADGITAPTLHDAQLAARRAFVASRLQEPGFASEEDKAVQSEKRN